LVGKNYKKQNIFWTDALVKQFKWKYMTSIKMQDVFDEEKEKMNGI